MGTRESILDSALECFTEDGYDRTTVARIREHSGVSNGALFHHFSSKEAIAGALYIEAMRSVQDGFWNVIRQSPATLREAVAGVIRQQLSWIEDNPDRARFLYGRGQLDWTTDAGGQLKGLNRDLADVYQDWLAPFVVRGEAKDLPMTVVVAIVTGPAHAIAQRWLAGQLPGSLLQYADELIDAAVAALSGVPSKRSRRHPQPTQGRIRVQLLGAEGSIIAEGDAVAELIPVKHPR
ncbi:TetR/AcrR family transcriptional regulator [Mycobacterium sp.]|uniref:TetR/AcrR family transcriptional regulator n=1 Tax=Mycobacterium sp. TaxID=1785 RepID=UPI0028BDAFF0|nr:TetR/AcrR family transcriptional regulator [Mycobacterium sp.]